MTERLRGAAYAAARDESVLRPALTSTVFPALPRQSRKVFRLLLIGLVVLLTALALMRWQAPLIGVVGVGLPLLFVLYLSEARHFPESSRSLLIAAVLGIGFGVGWALATEAAIARSGPDALGTPTSTTRALVTGLAIPLGFVALVLAPVLLVRLRRDDVRKPLNGYAIGALGAYCFTAAGTLTRLAPTFATGTMADPNRSATGLAVAAAIQGLAIPLTAAAVAGAVGATLWVTPRVEAERRASWYSLTSPIPSLAFGVLAYLGLGLLDFGSPPYDVEMGVYAMLAVLALYVQRIVLHCTLFGGTADDSDPTAVRTPRTVRPIVIAGVGAALIVVSTVALSLWLTPPQPNYVCPPDCERPPISKPVATNPRFTSSDGQFSVSYPGEGTAYEATFEPNGVVLNLLAGDGGTLQLSGEPAADRTPRQIAEDLIVNAYPNATTDYEIPNALVGYQLGYGEVADVYPANSVGGESRLRLLVMVAVKNDYAVIAAGVGPYHEFSPDFGSGHPSGANFLLALDMGKYVNSFRWRGDPPR